jgi:2-C-methyl-D-erythritol 2,4-cyclodiphosphate synthase
MDGLLGAAALGDIGKFFPDSDSKYKGISSLKLLERVMDILKEAGWFPVNVDITIIAEEPKMAGFIEEMRANLAKTLLLDVSAVSVKATTTEGMGFTGRAEGIAAQAIVLIVSTS